MAQIKNIKKPGEQIRGADVGFAALDKNGNVVGTGITEDDLFELPEGAQTGDVLAWGGETGAEWRPHYPEGGNAGDVLKLGETGPEWAADPAELPAIGSGDAGKVLAVNAGETGVEWTTPGGGGSSLFLHNIQLSDTGHDGIVLITIINSDATPITSTALLNAYLTAKGFTSFKDGLNASGKFDDNGYKLPYKVFANGTSVDIKLASYTGTGLSTWSTTSMTFNDVVVSL